MAAEKIRGKTVGDIESLKMWVSRGHGYCDRDNRLNMNPGMQAKSTAFDTESTLYEVPHDIAAQDGKRITAGFAFLSRTPDWETSEGELEWGIRYTADGPLAAATLLGVFARLVAEVGEEKLIPSMRLRECLTYGVIHRVRSDPQFRQQFATYADVAIAFDSVDAQDQLNVDEPSAYLVSASQSQFVRLVLDLFSLRPLVKELQAMILECKRYDEYVSDQREHINGEWQSESPAIQ